MYLNEISNNSDRMPAMLACRGNQLIFTTNLARIFIFYFLSFTNQSATPIDLKNVFFLSFNYVKFNFFISLQVEPR